MGSNPTSSATRCQDIRKLRYMHDIKKIRENPKAFDEGLKKLGHNQVSRKILDIDQRYLESIQKVELLSEKSNQVAKKIGQTEINSKEWEKLRHLGASLKEEKRIFKESTDTLKQIRDDLLLQVPNLPDDLVPEGKDESDNRVIRQWGEIPNLPFKPKKHFNLPCVSGQMDFQTASEISGSRFSMLFGTVARLHRALAMFMVDHHIEQGLVEVWSPLLVREEAMVGTGQLPKFEKDSFMTTDGKWLIPTSEVTLTNIVRGKTVDVDRLPLRYFACSQCFRSEAGSAGKDTSGLMRQHQFEKVEMVSIVLPEDSEREHARMLTSAEKILERLELPYRTVLLCSGDTGFSSTKTYDLEVWVPSQNKYREISSISNCKDFQSRRMNAKYRDGHLRKGYLHTLNGSGLAVGRTLISVLENYQREDGSVEIPIVLRPYLGGRSVLNCEGNYEL